jgi:peptide deformylase
MAVLPIYNCYHPILKKKTDRIDNIDGTIKQLAESMFETMYVAVGIGLAGNQVGENKSIIVIDVSQDKEIENPQAPFVMINPEIVAFSDDEIDYQEGCLSVPKFYEDVIRPVGVQVRFYDLNGKEQNMEADDILARVIQHEIDHLNGILFFERLNPLRRALSKNKLKRIQKGLVIPNYPMIDKEGNLMSKEI